ncbi:MAG: alpha/beta fold hydrolase [Terriglobus roseus]|nr:alpha/beta fold hydrolase [Terriglobus roseus]
MARRGVASSSGGGGSGSRTSALLLSLLTALFLFAHRVTADRRVQGAGWGWTASAGKGKMKRDGSVSSWAVDAVDSLKARLVTVQMGLHPRLWQRWHTDVDARLRRVRSAIWPSLAALHRYLNDVLKARLPRGLERYSEEATWLALVLMVGCGAGSCLWLVRRRRSNLRRLKSVNGSVTSVASSTDSRNGARRTIFQLLGLTLTRVDASSTEPGLLKKHSEIRSYTITVAGRSITYPSVRTFYHPHPQAAKLPTTPTPLPLLVFIHGLGGSVAQFNPLLTSLVNVASCLAIDLPGCGLSAFEPKDWDAYKLETMAELIGAAIEQHRDKALGQEVVLIGHSMGCSLAVLLASTTSPTFAAKQLSKHILGLIAICPRAEPPTAKEVATFKKLLSIPGPVFDLWRSWDRRGGTESASVARFVGPDAEEETKRLQVRFNDQSKTPVWRRMANGILPDYSKKQPGGLPGKDLWQGLDVPVMLIAGEADKVTPATELEKIAAFLGKTSNKEASKESHISEALVDSAAPVDTGIVDEKKDELEHTKGGDTIRADSNATLVDEKPHLNVERKPVVSTTHAAALKTTILPSPAAHALLYAPSTVRIIAGLIQSFLASHVEPRLSLGWQLQYLTTEGKWDVKNLAKWQKVQCVSDPIPGPPASKGDKKRFKDPWKGSSVARALSTSQSGVEQHRPVFRAMKTLREVDDVHSPAAFVKQWGGRIKAVVDISHESPVYSPEGLEEGGIQYHKFPTVSKLPPTPDEVQNFITLIDRLREELGVAAGDGDDDDAAADSAAVPVIGVHCHYGYNRTGFFLVSYLVERLGFRLQDAIDEFERQRPPGIRHGHFIDALFVRYCVGLKRAPTL